MGLEQGEASEKQPAPESQKSPQSYSGRWLIQGLF
jgi:hypothetical protein